MNLKNRGTIAIMLLASFLCQSCSSSTSPLEDYRFEQTGTLSWGGSPAADGVGILFKTEDEIYGAPGDREDYRDYFPENEHQVQITADIKLTGDTIVRGWGTEFPEIKFMSIKIVE